MNTSGTVRITCACEELVLRDLGLRLTRGAEIFLNPETLHSSSDLKKAREEKRVLVRFPPPEASAQRAPEPAAPTPGLPPPAVAAQLMGCGYQLLAAMVELTGEMRALRSVWETAGGLAPTSAPPDGWNQLLQGMQQALEGRPGAAPGPSPLEPAGSLPQPLGEPLMFIPNLDGGLGESSVQVSRQTGGEDGTLDSTAAALKALRRSKPEQGR